MSQSQWKAYFSMFVLGQTDPIGNSICSSSEWEHQSCPWYATVINFENRSDKKRTYCQISAQVAERWAAVPICVGLAVNWNNVELFNIK